MAKRVDPATKAAAERGAADAVTRWDWPTLQSPHAAERLVKSWGLELPAAQRIVGAERHRRPRA
jgi:tRNA U34 5-methylaminomethyl-2-thiouridine-forming methyltransferase MnmC